MINREPKKYDKYFVPEVSDKIDNTKGALKMAGIFIGVGFLVTFTLVAWAYLIGVIIGLW
jgi:hypothetical protein